MREDIRQRGHVILQSDDGVSIPVIFNNITGKNLKGSEYQTYLKDIVFGEMGFTPGKVSYHKDGIKVREALLPDTG